MKIGDIVVRKSYKKDIAFKIIELKEDKDGNTLYILKGMNLRIIADAPENDLEIVRDDYNGEKDIVFNRAVKDAISRIIGHRSDTHDGTSLKKIQKTEKIVQSKELIFGRPGKILHIDGDNSYLENCLKVYKQLGLIAEGFPVKEKDQPTKVIELVKTVKPDIVVLTGHDGMIKEATDYMDINNYRNSKYFVQSVIELRNYNSSYDELVIFAGACQSCYESILDAGANFASSPSRVLIHCLDPVFICEKVAYTNIDKIVPINEILENTITGVKGIGGLQTRGKYREGYPKSPYI